jgi:hypothetical protein
MLQCSTNFHRSIIGKFHRQFQELRHFLYLCPSSLRRGISHSRDFSICSKFYFLILRAISYPYMIPHSERKQLSELPGKKLSRPAGVMHNIRTDSARKNGSKIANICMHQPADLHSSISKANPTAEHPSDGPSTVLFASAIYGDYVGRSMCSSRGGNGGICREQYRTSHPGLELNWPIGLLNRKSAGNNREVRKAQTPLRASLR